MLMKPTGTTGTGWVAGPDGSLRNSFNGDPSVMGVYYRYESVESFAPPYQWSGKVRTVELMSPPVFANGTPAWYRPGLVIHPMYGSDGTSAAGNDENVLIGLGTYDRPAGHVGISAELRAERPPPANPYGVRTGYARKHVRGVAPSPFWDGRWHQLVVTVHSHNHYTLSWDGRILADVVENSPATIPPGRCKVGLRCDFAQIEIKDFKVTTEEGPVKYRIVPRSEVGLPSVVTSSNGSLRPLLRNARYLTAHYTGNNIDYSDKDTAELAREIQAVFQDTKPFEYGYLIGQESDDRIIEFSGKYQAAHSTGENGEAVGVLFALGIGEKLTDTMIDKWRWLRDVLIADGTLRPDVDQRPHKKMPGAQTACAGKSIDDQWAALVVPWGAPAAVPTAQRTGDDDMITLDRPIRMLDTRDEMTAPLPSGTWPQKLPAGIPADASAIFVTATATKATTAGFITLWGSGERLTVSNLNYPVGNAAIANTTLTRVVGGKFQMFNSSPVHIILDVIGYTA